MALISMKFLLFVLAAAGIYYLIPGKYQWIWLLIVSYVYYLSHGWGIGLFLLCSTLTSFGAGVLLDKIEDKKKRKGILVLTLIVNFGILGILKYTNFLILNVNHVTGGSLSFINLVLPIGISFYTFQSMGYLLDVYWKRYEPERNPFRFALFVSFFPQILQGPIGRYSRLGQQFAEIHIWDWSRMERAIQLILWGFFKKMVLADTAAPFVNAMFDQYEQYQGVAVFAVLAYSIQLYGDFSGGMDVVMGVAQFFGISLDENFRRPFFARSITDFWHRWHITLGTWMKDYVFYPVSLSPWMGRLSRFLKKTWENSWGVRCPSAWQI